MRSMEALQRLRDAGVGERSTLMSKGHGLIMQRILEEVTGEWLPVVYLSADIEGIGGSRSDRPAEESCRRACKRLATLGLVELAYQAMITGHITPPKRPPAQRSQLVVRRKDR